MEKTGRIISMPIQKRNGVEIVTVEYDTPEAELCSIKATDSRNGCSAGCEGGCCVCGHSTQEGGLFVVQGNIVHALNVSGKDAGIGKRVNVFISEKAALFQGMCALGIPFVLAVLCFTLIFLQTHNESLALAGIAGGLMGGAAIAFGINRMAKERALPQVVAVYD